MVFIFYFWIENTWFIVYSLLFSFKVSNVSKIETLLQFIQVIQAI